MEHGEEIQLAESGKIQVIDTCFSVSARPVRNYCFAPYKDFWGGLGVQLVIGLLEGRFAS